MLISDELDHPLDLIICQCAAKCGHPTSTSLDRVLQELVGLRFGIGAVTEGRTDSSFEHLTMAVDAHLAVDLRSCGVGRGSGAAPGEDEHRHQQASKHWPMVGALQSLIPSSESLHESLYVLGSILRSNKQGIAAVYDDHIVESYDSHAPTLRANV